MGVAHVGLVHRDPCKCKVKGFRAVSFIERNVSNRRHLQGVRHLPTIVEELKTSTEQVQPSPPVGTNIYCTIVVQESMMNEKTWHIARIPKTSAKVC